MNLTHEDIQRLRATSAHTGRVLETLNRHTAVNDRYNRLKEALREAAFAKIDCDDFDAAEALQKRHRRICDRHCKVLERQIVELDALKQR